MIFQGTDVHPLAHSSNRTGPVCEKSLNQPIPEMIDVEGVGNFEQPKCPRCQSLHVAFMEHMHGWTCSACGNEWTEPGNAPSFS
jgi:ribosomal protein L37AE/L43A